MHGIARGAGDGQRPIEVGQAGEGPQQHVVAIARHQRANREDGGAGPPEPVRVVPGRCRARRCRCVGGTSKSAVSRSAVWGRRWRSAGRGGEEVALDAAQGGAVRGGAPCSSAVGWWIRPMARRRPALPRGPKAGRPRPSITGRASSGRAERAARAAASPWRRAAGGAGELPPGPHGRARAGPRDPAVVDISAGDGVEGAGDEERRFKRYPFRRPPRHWGFRAAAPSRG